MYRLVDAIVKEITQARRSASSTNTWSYSTVFYVNEETKDFYTLCCSGSKWNIINCYLCESKNIPSTIKLAADNLCFENLQGKNAVDFKNNIEACVTKIVHEVTGSDITRIYKSTIQIGI